MGAMSQSRFWWQQIFLATIISLVQYCLGNPVNFYNPRLVNNNYIQSLNLPCVVLRTGMEGVCMFATHCVKANGTHLGTCRDRFYFKSCCQLHDEPSVLDHDFSDNSIDQNTISHYQRPSSVEMQHSTTTSFKYTSTMSPPKGEITYVPVNTIPGSHYSSISSLSSSVSSSSSSHSSTMPPSDRSDIIELNVISSSSTSSISSSIGNNNMKNRTEANNSQNTISSSNKNTNHSSPASISSTDKNADSSIVTNDIDLNSITIEEVLTHKYQSTNPTIVQDFYITKIPASVMISATSPTTESIKLQTFQSVQSDDTTFIPTTLSPNPSRRTTTTVQPHTKRPRPSTTKVPPMSDEVTLSNSTKRPTTISSSKPSRPSTQSADKPSTQLDQRPTTQSVQRPTQSDQRPITQFDQRPTSPTAQRPTTQSTQRPTTQSGQKPTIKLTQRPTTLSDDQPTTQSSRRPTTQSTIKPTTSKRPTLVTKRPSVNQTNIVTRRPATNVPILITKPPKRATTPRPIIHRNSTNSSNKITNITEPITKKPNDATTTEQSFVTLSYVETTKSPRPKPRPTASIVKVPPTSLDHLIESHNNTIETTTMPTKSTTVRVAENTTKRSTKRPLTKPPTISKPSEDNETLAIHVDISSDIPLQTPLYAHTKNPTTIPTSTTTEKLIELVTWSSFEEKKNVSQLSETTGKPSSQTEWILLPTVQSDSLTTEITAIFEVANQKSNATVGNQSSINDLELNETTIMQAEKETTEHNTSSSLHVLSSTTESTDTSNNTEASPSTEKPTGILSISSSTSTSTSTSSSSSNLPISPVSTFQVSSSSTEGSQTSSTSTLYSSTSASPSSSSIPSLPSNLSFIIIPSSTSATSSSSNLSTSSISSTTETHTSTISSTFSTKPVVVLTTSTAKPVSDLSLLANTSDNQSTVLPSHTRPSTLNASTHQEATKAPPTNAMPTTTTSSLNTTHVSPSKKPKPTKPPVSSLTPTKQPSTTNSTKPVKNPTKRPTKPTTINPLETEKNSTQTIQNKPAVSSVTNITTIESTTTSITSTTTDSITSTTGLPILFKDNVTDTTTDNLTTNTTSGITVPSIVDEYLATTIPTLTSTLIPSLEGVDYRQVCGKRMFPEPRIVGGSKASFGRWPWQISLRQWRTSTYLHKCGAALLNENWAITAAHCVDNVPPSDLLLRLGEYDLAEEEEPYGYQERRVQIVASHPQFDPRTFEYDLALLRFYEPVDFQPNIIPVCVPDGDENFIGRTAFVTGWGRLYEDGPLPSVLQEVSVPVINNTICETMYRNAGYIEHIPHIFICAGWRKGGYDSCEGDSGGPMVIQRDDKRFLLAGVISWGIGCAEPNQPGVYTRISEFREWINQILQF